jgi:hypothetical protein
MVVIRLKNRAEDVRVLHSSIEAEAMKGERVDDETSKVDMGRVRRTAAMTRGQLSRPTVQHAVEFDILGRPWKPM